MKSSRLSFLFGNDSFVTIDDIKEKFKNTKKLNGKKNILIFKGNKNSVPTLFLGIIKLNKTTVSQYLKGHFQMGTIFIGLKDILKRGGEEFIFKAREDLSDCFKYSSLYNIFGNDYTLSVYLNILKKDLQNHRVVSAFINNEKTYPINYLDIKNNIKKSLYDFIPENESLIEEKTISLKKYVEYFYSANVHKPHISFLNFQNNLVLNITNGYMNSKGVCFIGKNRTECIENFLEFFRGIPMWFVNDPLMANYNWCVLDFRDEFKLEVLKNMLIEDIDNIFEINKLNL